jgi:translation initiation factor 3 subunit A
MCRNFNTR